MKPKSDDGLQNRNLGPRKAVAMLGRTFTPLHAHLHIVCVLWTAFSAAALAQDSSIFRRQHALAGRPPLTLENGSFLYTPRPPVKILQLNDIVTVVVNINTRVLSEGEVDNRKRAQFDATLLDWIRFEGSSLKPSPQSDGDPRINARLNSLFRAESELETWDSLTFTIAAKVVDIRPNGNLVIEAHRSIQNNHEVWEQSLTGVIRRVDVGFDNKVLSEDVAELRINKREAGQVRDAYRRGWFHRIYDRYKPF